MKALIYGNKKLAISGIAGVLIASLIIASVKMAPWSELAKSFSSRISPDDQPILLNPTNADITVDLSISNFTEPLGPGSEANVTVTVISKKDVSNVTVKIAVSPIYMGQGTWPNITWTPIGPQGVGLVDGNSTWMINLTANVSESATIRVKATEVGLGVITVTAVWWETQSTFYKSEGVLYIRVLQDNIVVQDLDEVIIFP